MKRTADYIGPEYWNQNLIFSDDFLLCYGAMRMARTLVIIGEIGYWHNFDTIGSTTANVWKLDGYRLLNPEKSNKKILDFIIITERIMELTDEEPQFAEFRESNMRKLGEDDFMSAVARSAYYDRYLTICADFINWKYIPYEMKQRNIEFLKHLLSFNVGITKKFGYILDSDSMDDDNYGNNDDNDSDYDDDMINNGIDDNSNKEVLEKIKHYDWMYGAIGIHPENVDNYKEEDLEYVIAHINDNKVVAIGEIGLDYHYSKENKEKQIELFEKQLELAERYNVPVIVHSREATLDTIECLKKYRVRGVIHSFSGSYETAIIYIKMGFLLGINGVVTFKNCNSIDMIKKIGIKHIILETDSPYLTPVPYRGKKNYPSHVIDIVNFLVEKLSISEEEIASITENNIKEIFDI